MNTSMFFLVNSLDVKRGGLTKASLNQANTFANMGYDTHILTFDFNTRYDKIRKNLIETDQLNKNVKVLNMYEELCGEEELLVKPEPIETGVLDPHVGHNAYRVYENGLYTRYKKYHDDGILDFVDYFNEQRYRTKKEVYDENGVVRKVSYMDINLNKPRQMVYYRNDSQPYLSKWVNPENGRAIRVNVHEINGNIKKIFKNDEELKTDWIENVIEACENPVLVSDARNTDILMIKVKNKKAAKIWRLHSSHLAAPYETDSDIAPTVQTGINHIDHLDAALVLTNQQKIDIENRIGKRDNLFVLPHAAKSSIKKGLFGGVKVEKDEKLAVVIGRYSAIKNLNHIIKAFKIVLKSVPDVRLELWGEGPERENLQKLIKELKLTENVSLKGYTQNPSDIYQGALFSVLASKTEGFALSVLESMSNCTPVVSYDIRYGPRELIDHHKNGLLVEKYNVDKLAEAMITMFNNPKDSIKMGKLASKKIEKNYNQKLYEEKWINIVNKVINNRHVD
ncbi:glycosyltransferase [Heyndrickxia sp. FSL W8-0423]|uniref:glycosyltransferase n=1 Tax=Heyndrickxia sp. FSL W8-0423 TaxID=2921601 RepID=UPI0030FC05C8